MQLLQLTALCNSGSSTTAAWQQCHQLQLTRSQLESHSKLMDSLISSHARRYGRKMTSLMRMNPNLMLT